MTQHWIAAGQGLNYEWANDHIFVKTPQDASGEQVTLIEDTLKPGFHLPRHHHRQTLEIFYILEGEVSFQFDDETVVATPGVALTLPPHTWHEVRSPAGAKMLTILSPGGFDRYMEVLASLPPEALADEGQMTALSEKYDIWMR